MDAESWHYPISRGGDRLFDVLEEMGDFKLNPEDVPLIIKLIENPEYKTSRLFTGAVDLFTHDCIHVLLGRGLLVKDEAFVIGFTMGSTKKMTRWRRNLFMFASKYLYPEGYKFNENERYIFYSGVLAGEKCPIDLTTVKFNSFANEKVSEIRDKLGIDVRLLECIYCVEQKLFPDKECQRLI